MGQGIQIEEKIQRLLFAENLTKHGFKRGFRCISLCLGAPYVGACMWPRRKPQFWTFDLHCGRCVLQESKGRVTKKVNGVLQKSRGASDSEKCSGNGCVKNI